MAKTLRSSPRGSIVSFTLTGTDQLEAILAGLPRELNKGTLTKILKKNAQPIADDAASKIKNRTGALSRSVKVGTQLSPRQKALDQSDNPETQYTTKVYIGAGPLPYAHIYEFGSSRQAPHPFLRPAWEAGKSRMWSGITADIWRLLAGGSSKFRKSRMSDVSEDYRPF